MIKNSTSFLTTATPPIQKEKSKLNWPSMNFHNYNDLYHLSEVTESLSACTNCGPNEICLLQSKTAVPFCAKIKDAKGSKVSMPNFNLILVISNVLLLQRLRRLVFRSQRVVQICRTRNLSVRRWLRWLILTCYFTYELYFLIAR